MKKLRIKTSRWELTIEGAPPWLAAIAIAAIVFLVVSGGLALAPGAS